MSVPSSDSGAASRSTGRSRWREYRNILLATLIAGLFLKLFVIEAYRIPSPSMEDTLYAGDFLLVSKLTYGPRTPRYLPFSTVPIPSFSSSWFGKPSRGDVVVFESPVWPGQSPGTLVNYVKRCIAGPGDTVRIENSTVIVNGERLRPPEHARKTKLIPFPPDYVDDRLYPDGAPFNADNYGPLPVPRAGQTISVDTATIWLWKELIRREGHTVDVSGVKIEIDGEAASAYVVEHDYYFMMGDNRRNSLDSRFWGLVPDTHLIGKAVLIYWSWDEEAGVESFAGRLGAIRWERIGSLIH